MTKLDIGADLQARINAAAERAGKSPETFVIDAITETVEHTELEDKFHDLAAARWDEFSRTGLSVPWDSAKPWLEAKARGENPPIPQARKLDR
jgi:uncharacterized protein (DUF1778 family)